MPVCHIGTGTFPIVLNLFEFTPGEHTLLVTATDSTGQSDTYLYTFFGSTPPGTYIVHIPH